MKHGLVMEGGAMRGLFTAGVIDVMMEQNIVFDGAVGVSAGAVFGCNYKSRQIGRVLRYNLAFCQDPRYCSMRSRIKTGDLFGADFCYRHDCSVVGYEVGEAVPARELLYGCILSSGADASLGLAVLSAGSQEAFVERMNEKAAELGLSEGAHFTNCVGLYAPEHRCTARDMALILRAAMENELCREILTTKRFHTAATDFHPEGQDLSNWFLRRIEDKDCGGVEVLAAKTGYVAESGSCAASFAQDAEGRGYLCVTGNAHSAWRAIYDHVEVYSHYVP